MLLRTGTVLSSRGGSHTIRAVKNESCLFHQDFAQFLGRLSTGDMPEMTVFWGSLAIPREPGRPVGAGLDCKCKCKCKLYVNPVTFLGCAHLRWRSGGSTCLKEKMSGLVREYKGCILVPPVGIGVAFLGLQGASTHIATFELAIKQEPQLRWTSRSKPKSSLLYQRVDRSLSRER